MTQVHEVLSAISEASAALNREPELQRSIMELQRKLGNAETHNQELELHIHEYKGLINDLQSKLRSLEVERDDYAFRELEATDKLDSIRSFLRNTMETASSLLPKPVEISEAPVATDSSQSLNEMKEAASAASGSSSNPTEEQRDTPFTSAPTSTDLSPDVFTRSVSGPSDVTTRSPEMGQSADPFPTTSSTLSADNATQVSGSGDQDKRVASNSESMNVGQSESPLPSAPSMENQSQAASSLPVEQAPLGAQPSKPYEGKTYSEVFGTLYTGGISQLEWHTGGGTMENWFK